MRRYLIERTIPGAGQLTAADRQVIARKSCDVLLQLGPEIQWVQSYVTDDRFFCVYLLRDAEMIRSTPRAAGSRPTGFKRCTRSVDPTTAEAEIPVA